MKDFLIVELPSWIGEFLDAHKPLLAIENEGRRYLEVFTNRRSVEEEEEDVYSLL